jgi:hypothetical protein
MTGLFLFIYVMKWIKRIGFIGFMFFLIKGLIWLGIFISAYLMSK